MRPAADATSSGGEPDVAISSPPLDDLAASFDAAVGHGEGAVVRRCSIARSEVELMFATPVLADLLAPAFAHLQGAAGAEPELTIHVWDSASKGAARPILAPVMAKEAAPQHADPFAGPAYAYSEEAFQALYQPLPDILSVLSADGRNGWFWVAEGSRLPFWDQAAPFRNLLSWWLAGRGLQQVHGGAVGTSEGGVLFVGKGGSGKSTVSLSTLLEPRLRYAGDDYVALSFGDVPRVHSLFSSAKLEPDNLSRLPHVRAAVKNEDRLEREKAVLYVHEAFPEHLASEFPLRAVVLPRITPGQPRFVEASAAAALAAVAPSTVLQLRPPRGEALSALARLLERIPAFVLELGSDVSAVPAELVRLLDRLNHEAER
jgi:hypothetical protein